MLIWTQFTESHTIGRFQIGHSHQVRIIYFPRHLSQHGHIKHGSLSNDPDVDRRASYR